MNIKGIIYTICSAMLFGITPLLARIVYSYGASSITVVFFRSLLVLPILWLLAKRQGISLRIERYELKNLALIALFGSGLTNILLFTSYEYIDVGTATTLHFLYPVAVSILCMVMYRDVLPKVKLISLGIAMIGTFCFFMNSSGGNILGYLFAMASAITYAFYMVQMEKTRLAHRNAYLISFYIAMFVVVETLALHLITPSITIQIPLQGYGILLLLGIVSSFLAVVLLQYGIALLGSSTASLFCLFEPITSVLCGALFLSESITLWKLAGCIIIFSALIIMTIAEKKQHSKMLPIKEEIDNKSE